jgi:hypothetical protein
MFDFLSKNHHLPCGGEDGFLALLLPELNIKDTIREVILY